MEEYKFVQLSDDSDTSNSALKNLVDEYSPLIPKNYLYSVEKKNGKLILTWSTWKPTGAEKPFFKNKACEITGATELENLVSPEFHLAPSLERAVREIDADLRKGSKPNVPYALVKALHVWGLVDADYDDEFIATTYTSPSQSTLWFMPVLKSLRLTQKGEEYIEKGFLTEIRRSK